MKNFTLSTFLLFLSLANAKSQIMVSDSFNNAAISNNWVFINPNPDSYYQLNGSGELLISASAKNGGSDFCDCNGNFKFPRLLQKIDTANHHWRVTTKIRLNPTLNYQGAGLVFQTAADSSLGNDTANLIIANRYLNGTDGDVVDRYYFYTDSIVYLRAERDDDSIRSYFSSDGINWIKAFSVRDRPIYWAGINSSRYPWDGNISVDTHAYFDYFLVDYNYTLAVSLSNFYAELKNKDVIINWQTAQETNTNYFNIQRSYDGVHFTTINKKNAAGNSSVAKNYTYMDINAATLKQSKLYYRLEEVDKDGKSNYSNIRLISLADNSNFSISPNPAKDYINITSSEIINDAQIIISSANGRTLYSSKQSFINGEQLKVSVAQFASQTLFITINTANGKEQFKVVKE